jgi:hypothetical protein
MPSASRFTRGQGFFGKVYSSVSYHLGTASMQVIEKVSVFNVTSAMFLTLHTVPVTVIAAPTGTGQALVIDSAILKMVTTATQYASGGVVNLIYHGGSTAANAGSIPAAVINAGAGTVYTELGPAVAANGTTIVAQTAIDLSAATADFTTGTGTGILYLRYRIVTLP